MKQGVLPPQTEHKKHTRISAITSDITVTLTHATLSSVSPPRLAKICRRAPRLYNCWRGLYVSVAYLPSPRRLSALCDTIAAKALLVVSNQPVSALRFDGYYATGPVEWEDWHAGVRMHGIRFHFRRFYPNGEWLHCYRDEDFAFWEFTEAITPDLLADAKLDRAPRIEDADPLCDAGHYTVQNDVVTCVLAPDWTGGETWEFRYRIAGDRLVPAEPIGPHEMHFYCAAT